MALPGSTSLVDLTHIKLHLPPIVIPQQQPQQKQHTMTDGFMLFCADQTSPSLPVKATSVLYERWNALPSESKRPYYRQAIIVNAKLEEDDEPFPPLRPPPPPPATTMVTPKQLVPPEALRSAALEEREEAALGHQQPFASYPSFLSMKYSHEQKQSPQDQITPPLPAPDSMSPSSSLASVFNNDLNSTTHCMAISNLLPPPILQQHQHQHQQQRHDPRYLSDEQQLPPPPPSALPSQQRRKGSITLERLKRPPNAYLLFNRDMRRRLLDLDPKMTVSEISKDIGDRWKYLSFDERQPYIDAAQALKQDHLKNHPDFIYSRRSKAELAEAKRLSKAGRKRSLSSTSPKQQQQPPPPMIQHRISFNAINTDEPSPPSPQPAPSTHVMVATKKRGQQQSDQQRRDPRGRKKKQAGPKHPMSGFLFFLGAIRPQVARQFPGSTVGPISKEISARWKQMTAKDREPWLLKAEADKARYAQEMRIYMATQQQQQPQQGVMSPPHPPPRQVQDDDFDDDQVIATVVQMVNGPSPSTSSTSTSSSSLHYI